VSPHRKEELEKQAAMLNKVTNSPKSSGRTVTKENKEDIEEKRKKAAEFIMKIKTEKQDRKKKEEERKKQIENKLMKENEEYSNLFRKKQEEMMNRRKEESLKVYEQIKKKKEEEKKKLEETKPKVPRMSEEQYLYKKLEQRYNTEVLMPMLEEKKKELAQKRNKYKSIGKEEIEEHMRMHDFLKVQKETERLNELKTRRENSQEVQKIIRQIEKEKKQKENDEKKKLEINERKMKMENYAKLIRETHSVRPSDAKIAELQKKIAKLKHPVRQQRDIRKDYNISAIRNIPPKIPSSGNLPKPTLPGLQVNQEIISFSSEPSTSRKHRERNGPFLKKIAVRRDPKPPVNYLQEFRIRREQNNEIIKPPIFNWHSELNNDLLNSNEKYSRLMEKARLIDEQARRKELLLNVKGEFDLENNVSDRLIDSIKAKLAILEIL